MMKESRRVRLLILLALLLAPAVAHAGPAFGTALAAFITEWGAVIVAAAVSAYGEGKQRVPAVRQHSDGNNCSDDDEAVGQPEGMQ
jgi:hypothetical protein